MRIIVISFICISLLSTLALADDEKKPHGIEPYTPTKLDWLAVVLNSADRQDASSESPFSLAFIPNEKTDTIVVYVRYQPNVDRATMNKAIETAKAITKIYSKNYGWDGWVNIKEDVEPYKKN